MGHRVPLSTCHRYFLMLKKKKVWSILVPILLTRFHYIQKKCYETFLLLKVFIKKLIIKSFSWFYFLFYFYGMLEKTLFSLSSSDLIGLLYTEGVLKAFIYICEGQLETAGKWPYWKYQLTFSLKELVAATFLKRHWKKSPLRPDKNTQTCM